LEELFILLIREREKLPEYNGIWIATATEYLQSLRKEFPVLSEKSFIASGKKGWIFIPTLSESFDECSLKACDLILNGDKRIGRITKGRRSKNKVLK
jgi:hypothetical protein